MKAPYLRAYIQRYGYQLHLDATCDNGKGGVFVCMDGLYGWVLMAGKIPSENEKYLWPLVENTVERSRIAADFPTTMLPRIVSLLP